MGLGVDVNGMFTTRPAGLPSAFDAAFNVTPPPPDAPLPAGGTPANYARILAALGIATTTDPVVAVAYLRSVPTAHAGWRPEDRADALTLLNAATAGGVVDLRRAFDLAAGIAPAATLRITNIPPYTTVTIDAVDVTSQGNRNEGTTTWSFPVPVAMRGQFRTIGARMEDGTESSRPFQMPSAGTAGFDFGDMDTRSAPAPTPSKNTTFVANTPVVPLTQNPPPPRGTFRLPPIGGPAPDATPQPLTLRVVGLVDRGTVKIGDTDITMPGTWDGSTWVITMNPIFAGQPQTVTVANPGAVARSAMVPFPTSGVYTLTFSNMTDVASPQPQPPARPNLGDTGIGGFVPKSSTSIPSGRVVVRGAPAGIAPARITVAGGTSYNPASSQPLLPQTDGTLAAVWPVSQGNTLDVGAFTTGVTIMRDTDSVYDYTPTGLVFRPLVTDARTAPNPDPVTPPTPTDTSPMSLVTTGAGGLTLAGIPAGFFVAVDGRYVPFANGVYVANVPAGPHTVYVAGELSGDIFESETTVASQDGGTRMDYTPMFSAWTAAGKQSALDPGVMSLDGNGRRIGHYGPQTLLRNATAAVPFLPAGTELAPVTELSPAMLNAQFAPPAGSQWIVQYVPTHGMTPVTMTAAEARSALATWTPGVVGSPTFGPPSTASRVAKYAAFAVIGVAVLAAGYVMFSDGEMLKSMGFDGKSTPSSDDEDESE